MIKLSLILMFAVLIVFRGIFLGSIYWGDSPHFFPEEVQQFQSTPLTWTSLGNNFGGINLPLWLTPAMFLWKWLPPQILFIIPSILLSLIGPFLIARYLKLGKWTQFFSAVVYSFNTYFLLLIDGGQLGVALSYGIFPFTILFLKRLVDEPKFKNFYLALLFLFLNGLADPRIALVAVITVVIWNIPKLKNLLSFLPLGFLFILLNSFWIIPFFKSRDALLALGQLDTAPVKFMDPLLLFSPHWPDNLFGKINSPPLYFLGVPFLIFLAIYLSKNAKNLGYLILYLFFSALSIFPIGVIFRDSTKFYVPVILFAGILIGQTVDNLKKDWVAIAVFIYLIFLIHPAVLGKMNFVLSGRNHSSDFAKIYGNLKDQNIFFRTVWFPERHPLTFETEENPAIDAKELTKFLPFAYLNTGEDTLNFMNDKSFVDDFRTLGIKYLIFSGNPRELSKNQEEQKNWDSLITLVDKTKGLEKVSWETDFPIYEIPDTYPHIFAADKLIGVVGGVIPMKYPTVYFEDGKFDPSDLSKIDPRSFTVYLNGENVDDLSLSFLQRYFVFPKKAVSSNWAVYEPGEYLKYKYQLLIRGINFSGLDYGGGMAFSTVPGEKMVYKFDVPKDGEYVVAVRSMTKAKGENKLSWKLEKPEVLNKGPFSYTITNDSGFEVVNAVALFPLSDLEKARKLAEDYVKRFGIIEKSDLEKSVGYQAVNVQKVGTLKYKLNFSGGGFWIIFSDNFNESWQAQSDGQKMIHLPIYSMVNGFYTGGSGNDIEISFVGQKYFTYGVYISLSSLATLMIVFLAYEKFAKRSSKN